MYDPFPPKSILKSITTHSPGVRVEYKSSSVNPNVDVSHHHDAEEGLRTSLLDILNGGLVVQPNGEGKFDADVNVRVYVTVAADADNQVMSYLFAVVMNVTTTVKTASGPAEVIVWLLDAHGLQEPFHVADAVRQTVRNGLKDYTGRLAAAKAGPLGVSRGARCACGRDSWVGAEGADKTCEGCGSVLIRPAV